MLTDRLAEVGDVARLAPGGESRRRGQAAGTPRGAPGRDRADHGRARPRRPHGRAAQGWRPLCLRPGRRGGRGGRRGGAARDGRPRGLVRRRRAGECRHTGDPPRCQPRLHRRVRPRAARARAGERARGTRGNRRLPHGDAQPRPADDGAGQGRTRRRHPGCRRRARFHPRPAQHRRDPSHAARPRRPGRGVVAVGHRRRRGRAPGRGLGAFAWGPGAPTASRWTSSRERAGVHADGTHGAATRPRRGRPRGRDPIPTPCAWTPPVRCSTASGSP